MKLSGTRVVVVDDTRDDVSNLLTYLDRNGVPYNYFYEGGDVNNLPVTPLVGVRVVFLDFVLGTEGAPLATKMSTLMNVLSRVVSKDNGPYIIMLWTRHNEQDGEGDLVPDFKTRLFENDDVPNPIAVIDLNKVEAMQDIEMIETKINDSLTNQNVFEVLFDWEKNGHEAAMHVLERLQGLAQASMGVAANLDEYTSALQEEIKRHLYHFSVAASGRSNTPNPDVLIDAQIPFTAILSDKLEQNIKNNRTERKDLVDSVNSKSTQDNEYSEAEVSVMNSYFAISTEEQERPQPGNVYKRSALIAAKDKKEFLYLENAVMYEKNRYKNRANNAQHQSKYQELGRKMIPVLFEVTPRCDYAQKKWKGVKLVAGALCPVSFDDGEATRSYLAKMSNSDQLSQIGIYEYNGQPYKLILHAAYMTTMPLDKLQNVKPIFRAKKELLVYVQHWLANHASRPGKTEFFAR